MAVDAAPVVIAHPHETRNGVTILAAAPLSTLPEPVEDLAAIRAAAKRSLPLDAYSTIMLCDEIELLRAEVARLSSLERELDGVRNEREQWREAAESTLRLIDSAGARLDGMVRGASAARPAVLGDRSEAL